MRWEPKDSREIRLSTVNFMIWFYSGTYATSLIGLLALTLVFKARKCFLHVKHRANWTYYTYLRVLLHRERFLIEIFLRGEFYLLIFHAGWQTNPFPEDRGRLKSYLCQRLPALARAVLFSRKMQDFLKTFIAIYYTEERNDSATTSLSPGESL